MKKFFFISSFLLFQNNLFALSSQEAKLVKLFQENCSKQKIKTGISIASDNINVCNLVFLNNFPKKAKKQLQELNQQMIRLKEEIAVLKAQKTSRTVIHNKKEITIVQQKRVDLSKIEKHLNALKQESIVNRQSIEQVSQSLTKKYQTQLVKITQSYQNSLEEIDHSLEEKKQLQEQLSSLETRVQDIEEKVDEHDNVLAKYFKNINEHFGGISLLGAKSLASNPSTNIGNLAFQYEGFNLDANSALFATLSYNALEHSVEYQTLAEGKENDVSKEKFVIAEIGYRKLFVSQKIFNFIPYGSLSGGYAFGGLNAFVAKVALGVEHQHKSDTFLIELGYSYMDTEQSNTIQFNPLGNAKVVRQQGLGLPYVSIKYLWRMF